MKRTGWAVLAALAGAAPVAAAEGGLIRSGEHDGFSRLVLTIELTTEWSLESGAGRATIFFPGKALNFRTAGIFDLIPRTRVQDVRSETTAEGTTVEVALGCDCRISASFVGSRYLALDIGDRDAPRAEVDAPPPGQPASTAQPPPTVESAESRIERESAAVASAEQVLVQQIERAASQGLIQLAEKTVPETVTEAPAVTEPDVLPEVAALTAPGVSEADAPPDLPQPVDAAPAHPTEPLAGLLDHDQITATTVFDRDSASVAARMAAPATPPECRPDAEFDIARWSNGAPLRNQMPQLFRLIVGEFDAADPHALRDAARLYVHFGFGAEAESLLTGFGVGFPERTLLTEIARAVEGRPVDAGGPLALAAACPGRHGLWLALGGAAPAFHTAEHFAEVQGAFAELPPDLRALVGPGLMGRLIDSNHPDSARLIHETTLRPGLPASDGLRLAEARLVAAEGHPVEAAQALHELVARGASNADEALARMTRLALDNALPVPERVITDLRGAALQNRHSDREAELRGLLVEALASNDALGAAVAEVIAAKADLPAVASDFDALAVAVLADAAPDRVGIAAYAETMLAHADLIASDPATDGARQKIAGELIGIGLPNAALAMIEPASRRGGAAARLLVARARLELGDATAALLALGELATPEAVELRARALARGGDYGGAVAALADVGRPEGASPYVWPSGDWVRVPDATERAERVAMAGFMAAREGLADQPAPAADPAALPSEAAFQQPLPSLAAPSLQAARTLLATSQQIGGFVEDLLAED